MERSEQNVIGYIEIGQAIPLDKESNKRIFAVKISKGNLLKFELVVYLNTDIEESVYLGELNIYMELKDFISEVLKQANE